MSGHWPITISRLLIFLTVWEGLIGSRPTPFFCSHKTGLHLPFIRYAMIKKKRRKTGCLTCRTRRVKCDERKPNCERCEIANVHCAGYAEKRQLKIRHHDQSSITAGCQILPTTAIDQCIQPSIGDGNGLPLVALPVNPNPFQRPHSRARDMLGYHQYLYRTLPILFPPKSLHFWTDYLCEAAWEMEWVFDTIIALGSMHRATLLLSQKGGNDRHRGLDTKVIAIQTYIRALEGLSACMAGTKNPTPLAVGVLVLMAYIEVCCNQLRKWQFVMLTIYESASREIFQPRFVILRSFNATRRRCRWTIKNLLDVSFHRLSHPFAI